MFYRMAKTLADRLEAEGRVLSSKSRDDLRQAVAVLSQLIEQSTDEKVKVVLKNGKLKIEKPK